MIEEARKEEYSTKFVPKTFACCKMAMDGWRYRYAHADGLSCIPPLSPIDLRWQAATSAKACLPPSKTCNVFADMTECPTSQYC